VRYAAAILAVVLCALLVPQDARATTLDDVRRANALVWGGDQEGGAPYVFPRDDDPSKVTGFEVELAEGLAAYLKVKSQFAEGNWDKMPDLLKAQKIDIILNGYEWTPLRAELMESSIPYYVYGLQLMAPKADPSIASWEDLKKPKGGQKRKVGVLIGSSADRYVTDTLGDAVDISRYEGNTDAMRETETGKVDACVEDTPIAVFYAPRFAKLHDVGLPVAEGYYVIYARKGETDLVRALDEALVLMLRSGKLESIYKKYGIWDARQAKLLEIAEAGRFYGYSKVVEAQVSASVEPPREEVVKVSAKRHGFEIVKDYGGVMLQSAGLTVLLAVLSFPMAIALGLMIAIGRLYGPKWLRAVLTAYVEFLRGTPLMLQLYFIFFFLPEVGIKIPAFATAIAGLAVNYSAYESEVYRAGLQAIPPGQMEAALSLGMTRALAIRRVIVPQAARIVIPPVVNDFIALFKDTSVCSVVTLTELTKRYSVVSMSTQATVELMVMTAFLYLVMSYPMSLVAGVLEKRMGQAPKE
jgi:polar amino acid transport system substrate-binding protein